MNETGGGWDVIHSRSLDLVALPPPLMDALISGDAAAARALAAFTLVDALFPVARDDRDLFVLRRDQVRRDPSWAPWSLRAIVLRSANVAVGTATFHGPPGVNDTGTPGAAEIGYTVFAPHRGAGVATEAARAMIAWARRTHGVTHFISGVAPDNLPSLRVQEKLGFVPTGEIVDGELIFALRLS